MGADRARRRVRRRRPADGRRRGGRRIRPDRRQGLHHQRERSRHRGRHGADGSGGPGAGHLGLHPRARHAGFPRRPALQEARLARFRHRRAGPRGGEGAEGEPSGRARAGIPGLQAGAGGRTDRDGGDGRRSRPGGARPGPPLRQGAARLRAAPGGVPGTSGHAGGPGHGGGSGASPHAAGCLREGPGPSGHAGGVDGVGGRPRHSECRPSAGLLPAPSEESTLCSGTCAAGSSIPADRARSSAPREDRGRPCGWPSFFWPRSASPIRDPRLAPERRVQPPRALFAHTSTAGTGGA